MTSAEFRAIEQAWWHHVDAACPHPIHSRHRYTWIRDNRVFVHKGRSYQRDSFPIFNANGSRASGSRVVFADLKTADRDIEGIVTSAQSIMGGVSVNLSV